MTQEPATIPDPAVGDSTITPEDPPKKDPHYSYTHLAMDASGLWYCPQCTWLSNNSLSWAYEVRGYKKFPEDYDPDIVDTRPYGKDYANRLYFGNPPCVVECQNGWNDGFSGNQCDFNREKFDGFRHKDLEEECDKKMKILGQCSHCSILASSLRSQALKKRAEYIEKEETPGPTKTAYALYDEDPWFGAPMLIRPFLYNGSVESLKCTSTLWGAGNGDDNLGKTCPGRYGGPVVFWVTGNEKAIERSREMAEKGEFIEGLQHDLDTNNVTWYEMDWDPSRDWKEGRSNSEPQEDTAEYSEETSDSSSSWASRNQGDVEEHSSSS